MDPVRRINRAQMVVSRCDADKAGEPARSDMPRQLEAEVTDLAGVEAAVAAAWRRVSVRSTRRAVGDERRLFTAVGIVTCAVSGMFCKTTSRPSLGCSQRWWCR